MNFNNARKHLNGKMNFIANFGMMGDSLVFISLYLLYRYRKDRKEATYQKKLEEHNKSSLYNTHNIVFYIPRKQNRLIITDSLLILLFLIM